MATKSNFGSRLINCNETLRFVIPDIIDKGCLVWLPPYNRQGMPCLASPNNRQGMPCLASFN